MQLMLRVFLCLHLPPVLIPIPVTPELVSHVSSQQNRSQANCSGTSRPASRACPALRKLCLEKIISSINSSLR